MMYCIAKATLIPFIDGNCHINQLKHKSCNTYVTYHTWSISHHITLLVINALRGKQTHISTYKPKQFQEIRHAWFRNLVSIYVQLVIMHEI